MQIINFTEPLIKPALQDKSKGGTFRKAWDWLDTKKTKWKEQQECRHKVGNLEQIMWNQRGKNGRCENCVFCDEKNRCIADAYAKLNPEKYAIDLLDVTECMQYNINELFPDKKNPVFSKVFGVGEIVETPKVFMDIVKEENATTTLIVRDATKEPLEIITDGGIFFKRDTPSISQQDGFKNPVDFKNFFLKHYPILLSERMPFWRIKWEWQREL